MATSQGLAAFLPPPRPSRCREARLLHEPARESSGPTSSVAPCSPALAASLSETWSTASADAPDVTDARATPARTLAPSAAPSPAPSPAPCPVPSRRLPASPCLAAKNISLSPSEPFVAIPTSWDETEITTTQHAQPFEEPLAGTLLAEVAQDELDQLRAEERGLRRLWLQLQAPSQGQRGGSRRQAEESSAPTLPAEAAGTEDVPELQLAEQELLRLSRQAECQELCQRREAEEWRQAYCEARDAASKARRAEAESQAELQQLEKVVGSLREDLDKARADLEDARAACRATEVRVGAETRRLKEEVAEARQAAAGWLPAEPWFSETSDSFDAASAQERESCLRTELAELFDREARARSLLERLRDLRSDAALRLQERPLAALAAAKENDIFEDACPLFTKAFLLRFLVVKRQESEKGTVRNRFSMVHEHPVSAKQPLGSSETNRPRSVSARGSSFASDLQGGSCEQATEEYAPEANSSRQRLRLLQERAAKLHAIKEHLQRLSRQRQTSNEMVSDAPNLTDSGCPNCPAECREPPPRITRWQKQPHSQQSLKREVLPTFCHDVPEHGI
ncbi:Arsb [Symbiodinium natans]|uniref:Arsb protein n=1 Tax=Symbiodinium natans TaxID=878477 RepID=A0A812M8N2_9DINO|nr:Arsb [Symbiodinium natans]